MPEDALFDRADRAIAESKRLVDELREAVWKAERLDRNLQYLHWRRLEDEAEAHAQIHRTR
ncbi:hypothetical protein [Bradyrhizobium sp. USDA 4454]